MKSGFSLFVREPGCLFLASYRGPRPERAPDTSPGQTTKECRPGFESEVENRPRENIHKREILISGEKDNFNFSSNNAAQFRPKGVFCLENHVQANVG